jgi:hypothetical protein
MVVLLVLFTFAFFFGVDWLMSHPIHLSIPRGTEYTTPGFEMLGALAQDGGEKKEKDSKPV